MNIINMSPPQMLARIMSTALCMMLRYPSQCLLMHYLTWLVLVLSLLWLAWIPACCPYICLGNHVMISFVSLWVPSVYPWATIFYSVSQLWFLFLIQIFILQAFEGACIVLFFYSLFQILTGVNSMNYFCNPLTHILL